MAARKQSKENADIMVKTLAAASSQMANILLFNSLEGKAKKMMIARIVQTMPSNNEEPSPFSAHAPAPEELEPMHSIYDATGSDSPKRIEDIQRTS